MSGAYVFRTAIDEVVVEKTDRKIEFQVTDADGVGLPAASLTTLTATVYDRLSGTMIAPQVNILNQNGTSVDGAGNGVLDVKAAWLAIQDDTQEEETHVILIEWTYPTSRSLAGELLLRVANLAKRS